MWFWFFHFCFEFKKITNFKHSILWCSCFLNISALNFSRSFIVCSVCVLIHTLSVLPAKPIVPLLHLWLFVCYPIFPFLLSFSFRKMYVSGFHLQVCLCYIFSGIFSSSWCDFISVIFIFLLTNQCQLLCHFFHFEVISYSFICYVGNLISYSNVKNTSANY